MHASSTPSARTASLAWPMRHQPERTADERADPRATLACCHQGLQARPLLGLGSGDRFGDFRGGSGPLKGRVPQSGENQPDCRKARYQALFAGHIAAGRNLHGKEGGLRFESGRGLEKTCKSRFLVVRDEYEVRRGSLRRLGMCDLQAFRVVERLRSRVFCAQGRS